MKKIFRTFSLYGKRDNATMTDIKLLDDTEETREDYLADYATADDNEGVNEFLSTAYDECNIYYYGDDWDCPTSYTVRVCTVDAYRRELAYQYESKIAELNELIKNEPIGENE